MIDKVKAGTILTVILVFGIIGIALSLILIGVCSEKEEFVFMEGCYDWETTLSGTWKVSKLSNTETFDVCVDASTERWKSLPLKVFEETNSKDVQYSIDWINSSLGFEAFVLHDAPEKCDVFFHLNAPHGSWGGGAIDSNGATYHRIVNGKMYSDVFLSNVITPNEVSAAAVHELGHVLFLGHDEVEESFMHYPTLTMERIRVRDTDRGALRSLYLKHN